MLHFNGQLWAAPPSMHRNSNSSSLTMMVETWRTLQLNIIVVVENTRNIHAYDQKNLQYMHSSHAVNILSHVITRSSRHPIAERQSVTTGKRAGAILPRSARTWGSGESVASTSRGTPTLDYIQFTLIVHRRHSVHSELCMPKLTSDRPKPS